MPMYNEPLPWQMTQALHEIKIFIDMAADIFCLLHDTQTPVENEQVSVAYEKVLLPVMEKYSAAWLEPSEELKNSTWSHICDCAQTNLTQADKSTPRCFIIECSHILEHSIILPSTQ